MDVHTSQGPLAEAWVMANRLTTVNTEQMGLLTYLEDSPTQLIMTEQPLPTKTFTIKHQPPPGLISHSAPSSSTRSLPIHCIVERTNGPLSFDSSSDEKSMHNVTELDSYAILPGTTLLSECVQSALLKLGYSSSEILGAKGAVQMKNWKPLCFEAITDNKSANIDDILGELTQVATLRIRICSATKTTSTDEVKEKLLQLILGQSQTLLTNAGGQTAEKDTFPRNGQALATISPEMHHAFDRWYEEQLTLYTDSNCSSSSVDLVAAAKDLLALQQERLNAAMTTSRRDQQERQISISEKIGMSDALTPPRTFEISSQISRPIMSSSPLEPFSHPAYQHYLPGKTRMRTSFDPEHEIPRLQKWFGESQHPSRDQMIHYLLELNSLDSRKGRRPLDLTNIIYWFKNARAAHRRLTKIGDDSFEMEEDKETLSLPSENNIPYLPNRNAIYMVPYPQFPSHLRLFGVQNMSNGLHDDREPCDLSMSSQRSKSPINESHHKYRDSESRSLEEKINLNVVKVKIEKDEKPISHVKTDEGYSETAERSPAGNGSHSVHETSVADKCVKDLNYSSDMPKDFSIEKVKHIKSIDEPTEPEKDEPNDFSTTKGSVGKMSVDSLDDKPKNMSNCKQLYESEDDDDDFESDYNEEDHSEDGSISSHNGGKISSLHEPYQTSAQGLNFNGVAGSPSRQPLHIPPFPHHLARHYFPLNTHFFSQHSNQLKFTNPHSPLQQTSPKSSPKSGQENSDSHRKRRTRVFIDPLSEIPKLEKWFLDDTHPSSYMVDKYCEELNSSEYRQKFPKLEPKNVQLWFKNHRAKVKRMRLGDIGDHQMFD